jgi:beta-mannosidase
LDRFLACPFGFRYASSLESDPSIASASHASENSIMARSTLDLSTLHWTLTGTVPDAWRLGLSMELGLKITADISPVPARVPGSVQAALRDAGVIPDWRVGLNSRLCEWVEHRHWLLQTTLPAAWCDRPGRKIIVAKGLDYQGHVIIAGKIVGDFQGSFVPHHFDLTDALAPGDNVITIAFTNVPPYMGQVGFTSKITQWKERFNYSWDWTPRLVQIGVWDAITLEVDTGDRIEEWSAYTTFSAAQNVGQVHLRASLKTSACKTVRVTLADESNKTIYQHDLPADQHLSLVTPSMQVQRWNVRGAGPQTLYRLSLQLLDQENKILDESIKRLGFREITWQPCDNSPAGAEPWICVINNQPTFLRGFNWVPLLPNFADATEAQYRAMLATYHDIGTNVLRVWGGAMLEKEIFYNLCDELGILVWQEFPLSSSGVDNWPPEDPVAIREMNHIARSYITRRQHHASLLLWCGGNELQGSLDGSKTGMGKPVDVTHPMMAMMAWTVAALDPSRRFLPTSSTGPRFMADEKDFGKGLHHDVHGPWNHPGDLASWERYWNNDDALFRSESGMPGASPADLLQQFGGSLAMPASADNPWWNHISSWWIQWDTFKQEGGDLTSLHAFVTWSQQRQATFLTAAAGATQRRFPGVGGFIGWMGHDCYPCPANTSVIDCNARLKPAGVALRKLWTGR